MNDLFSTTMEMLKQTHVDHKTILRETGLGRRWLGRLIDGDFNDPGVKKIQKLHDYLTSVNAR